MPTLPFMLASSIRRFGFGGRLSLLSLLCLTSRAAAQAPAADAAQAVASDEKAACIAAFDQAQLDRAASHLLASQKQLLECSRPACGMSLMSECTQMYTDIERAVPSVVLSARDEARNIDLTAVEVALDGKLFAPSLDGRPIPLDPGEYEFTFTAAGHAPMQRRAVIGTGDKYRMINVVFPAGGTAPAPGPASVSQPLGPELSTSGTLADPATRGLPVMTYVLGGLSVVGFGTFGTLRIIANGDFDTLKKGCAPACPESDVSNLRQKFLFSNVALGVGAGAAVGAALWYVLDAPNAGVEAGVAHLSIEPARSGAMATARGTF